METGNNFSISSETGEDIDRDEMEDDRRSKAEGKLRMGAPHTPSRYEEYR
jgi:hypothetical protein